MTNAIRFAAAGTVALVAALAAWSAGGDPPDAEDHRLKIAAMTDAERSQLERKHNDFQRLSTGERETILSIHQALEDEPRLSRTLLDYEHFVSNLQLWDQTALREMPIDDRIERVEELVARRDRRGDRPLRSMLGARMPPEWVFGPTEFAAAMNIIEETLGLSDSESRQLRDLPSHERHFRLAQRADQKMAGGGKSPSWPDEQTIGRLLSQFHNEWLKDRILDDDKPYEDRREDTVGLLMRSLYAEWQHQAIEAIPEAELSAALGQLSEGQQAELQIRDPGELLRLVMDVIAKGQSNSRAFAVQFRDVTSLWRRYDRFARPRRGDRRGGDRDREGGRDEREGGRDGRGDRGGRGGFGPNGPPPPPDGFGPPRGDGPRGDGKRGRPPGDDRPGEPIT